MKTYYFNVETSTFLEFKISASNLSSALDQLLAILLSNNEPFKVFRDYYSDCVRTIPANLYKKYFDGYSF